MKRIVTRSNGNALKQKLSGSIDESALSVRLPKNFIWELMDRVIADLGFTSDFEDIPGGLNPALIDSILRAVKRRDMVDLQKSLTDFSVQSILEKAGDSKGTFFAIYQVCALLKKYPLNNDLAKDAALNGFLKYEKHCDAFQKENIKALFRLNRSHPDYVGIIDDVREDISRLLGTRPNVQRIFECATHGPGSAVGFEESQGKITNYFKWSELPYTVSSSAKPYAQDCIESDPRWIGALLDWYRNHCNLPQWMPIDMRYFWDEIFQTVEYCRYTSVPKTALTERPIAIEPTLNVFLQLGVDRVIKGRLKRRWGIDLSSQELNRTLALEGSLSNELVTLDLSGASDTVSRGICYLLLPPLWYDLLDDLRSKKIRLPKIVEPVELKKFSAMGNGFTFALETVIFTALIRAAMRRTGTKGNYNAYGDDLIIPTAAYSYLQSLLSLFGFVVNDSKSFASGPFRESCGKDYLSGTLVRPVFLKKTVQTVQDLFYLYNSLFKLEQDYWQFGLSFEATRKWLFRFIPIEFRSYYGPISETFESYRFSTAPPLKCEGLNAYLSIIAKARCYNQRSNDFFFRKLMHSLKESPVDKMGFIEALGGSAFDITIRGSVSYERHLSMAVKIMAN